jgi:hypothetical protein
MLMLSHIDREKAKSGKRDPCACWSQDGHAFIVRSRKEFVATLLPLFFRDAKFSSFTRKLYRWGFRQICFPKKVNRKDREMIFGHEHFQRDDKALMANMRSVTAAGTRRAIAALNAKKKAKDEAEDNEDKEASGDDGDASGEETEKQPNTLISREPTDPCTKANAVHEPSPNLLKSKDSDVQSDARTAAYLSSDTATGPQAGMPVVTLQSLTEALYSRQAPSHLSMPGGLRHLIPGLAALVQGQPPMMPANPFITQLPVFHQNPTGFLPPSAENYQFRPSANAFQQSQIAPIHQYLPQVQQRHHAAQGSGLQNLGYATQQASVPNSNTALFIGELQKIAATNPAAQGQGQEVINLLLRGFQR